WLLGEWEDDTSNGTVAAAEKISTRVKKQTKDDKDEWLLSIFKQIHINLPFLEAMSHMLKGSKVLKDLLSHKEKLKKAASSTKVEEEEDSNEVQAVSCYPRIEPVKPLEWKASKNRLKPLSIEPLKLELKELPKHLEYAFLQENNQLPVVISFVLSIVEKARLLERIKRKPYSLALTQPSNKNECLLDYAMLHPPFNPNIHKRFLTSHTSNDPAPAGHLSWLENLDLGKLTKAEIRDLIPEEQLMAVSNKNNKPWMNHFYSSNVVTESYKGASPEMRQHKSFGNVTADHLEDIMVLLILLYGTIPLVKQKQIHLSSYRLHVKMGREAMKRYGVVHRFSIAYHPQINGQVKNTNRAIKRILKKTIRNNKKDWSYKLDDALWKFRTAFQTPLRTTPLRIIYGKACHLPVELEHKTYWAIKNCNIDLTKAMASRFLQINELDKMRLDAYESSISYKERTKKWHNKRIKAPTNYKRGDMILLFNSHISLLPGKLKSRWYGP
nr:hypothetical protein [Tanacetum cinerariifolium]